MVGCDPGIGQGPPVLDLTLVLELEGVEAFGGRGDPGGVVVCCICCLKCEAT